MESVEIRHFHFCSGMAGAAKGFDLARPRVSGMKGVMRCVGAVDSDPLACEAFDRVTFRPGLATQMDLFKLEQYVDFWSAPPPPGWKQAQPDDIRRAAGYEFPHFVFMSPPCKSFSALVTDSKSREPKYAALSALPMRCWELALQAWVDDPPEVLWMENVERMWTRGRAHLDQIVRLLEASGYAVNYSTVNGERRPGGARCIGSWGRLGCYRPRFFLVARHLEKLPVPILEPPNRGYRSIGDVIGGLPLPGDPDAGPLHELPNLQWLTWLRLAMVMPGKDHRYLRQLQLDADGNLANFRLVKMGRSSALGHMATSSGHSRSHNVRSWKATSHTLTCNSRPSGGASSIADIRYEARSDAFGVGDWNEVGRTLTGKSSPSSGRFAVADPGYRQGLGVRHWRETANTLTGQRSPAQGWISVADPSIAEARFRNVYRVMAFGDTAQAITGGQTPTAGGLAVADERVPLTGYRMANLAATTEGGGVLKVPGDRDRGQFVIISPWGFFHRPFTKLDKLALMGFYEPGEEMLELPGTSTWQHEAIGNAVPVWSAKAIAEAGGLALLSYWSEQPMQLVIAPKWVKPHLAPFALS